MAETYTLKLYASGPFVGCQSEAEVSLSEYGYSDEEWDALTGAQRDSLLEKWGEEYFWNENYEYGAEVDRG